MCARASGIRSYAAAVRWLDSLQGSGIRPGLDRMRRLLKAVRNPHRDYETVIVAGTNGKGSTAATLTAILDAAGCSVGLYTSPHLVSLRERWRLNDRDATEEEILDAARELRHASEIATIVPTYFEALTVLAFILFRQTRREIVVLEVGLGGRLDATNVTRPRVALVSSISVDHREFLGNTIPSVAGEKAGVIHRGTIAVTSARDRDALDVIVRRAHSVGATISSVTDDCRFERVRCGASGISFTLATPRASYRLRSPLSGRFQLDNVALAVRGAEELAAFHDGIDERAIEAGVVQTRWRGRLERFALPGRSVWVDGGHNEGAATELVSWIRRSLHHPRSLVFGMMSDKDFEAAASLLIPLFDHVYVTLADPIRGCEPTRLAGIARRIGVPVTLRSNPRSAVKASLERGGNVLVCGSLYLAGAAIPLLDRIVARSDTMPSRRQKS